MVTEPEKAPGSVGPKETTILQLVGSDDGTMTCRMTLQSVETSAKGLGPTSTERILAMLPTGVPG